VTRLKIDLKTGDSVSFDDGRISITLLEKSGKLARLDVQAAKDVKISHSKLRDSSMASNGITVAA
jgi:sRNA-binding carbon storage regulator CsrA